MGGNFIESLQRAYAEANDQIEQLSEQSELEDSMLRQQYQEKIERLRIAGQQQNSGQAAT